VARGPRVQLGAGQSAHAPRNRAFIIDFQRRTEKWLSGEGMADEFTAHATLLWATLGWLIDALERRSGSLGAAELAGPPTNSLQPALSFAPSSRRQGPYGGPLLPLE
jgi:hypothetical protein